MEDELLKSIGLTEGESKVYISLLELGQSSITNIITKSKVSTSKSYDILNRLEEKGLVSHIILKGIKYFKASSPERLKEILVEKNKEIEKNIDKITKILPDLLTKQKLKEKDEEAEIFIGLKGLISIFNEETEWMKKTRKFSYVIGATRGGMAGKNIEIFFEKLQIQRDKNKLKTKFIFNKKMKGKFTYLEKSKYCYIKYIEVGSEMTSINIFDNKTVITVYAKQPFIFVIKSSDVAKDFREYFEQIWKIAKN